MKPGKTVPLVLTLLLLLAGCREGERGRQLSFEPGVYKGPRTEALNVQQKREINDRHRQVW